MTEADDPTSPAGTSARPQDPAPATTPATTGPATGPTTDPTPSRRAKGLDAEGHVRRSRVGVVWVTAIVAAILVVLMLVFIAQNSDSVTVRFLGWEGSISLAVALLASAVAGILIVAIPGSVRIFQLRRALVANDKHTRRG